jgi:hypothetical protein
MKEFIACFSGPADPRQENVRHNLHEVLIFALSPMLYGGEDCSGMAVFGSAKQPPAAKEKLLQPASRLTQALRRTPTTAET